MSDTQHIEFSAFFSACLNVLDKHDLSFSKKASASPQTRIMQRIHLLTQFAQALDNTYAMLIGLDEQGIAYVSRRFFTGPSVGPANVYWYESFPTVVGSTYCSFYCIKHLRRSCLMLRLQLSHVFDYSLAMGLGY